MPSQPIYLDYAAATPLDAGVEAAMQPYFSDTFYNPSATYLRAKQVRTDLEAARANVAKVLGARPSEIIFTAGGTEANNLAIHGVLRAFPGKTLLVSSIEHESVRVPAAQYDTKTVVVSADGTIDLADVSSKLTDETVLVSVMYANNEVGTIQPIAELSHLIADLRRERVRSGNLLPLYLHTDACQASNYLDLQAARLGVDLMTLNGGKIYGPKQSGALYVKAGVELHPLIEGGGQERAMRSGTENVPGCIGFSHALVLAQSMRHEQTRRLQDLQKQFWTAVRAKLPTAIINGSQKTRLPNNLHLSLPGTDNERVLMQLDEQGIMAAAGSACSASDEEPSHVLLAIGLSVADAQSSLRLTMGRGTTWDMLDYTLQQLVALTARTN